MSKDVENGPLVFELAHFENIFVSKPTVGTNFRQVKTVKYFLVAKYNQFFIRDQKVLFQAKGCADSRFWDENIFKTS